MSKELRELGRDIIMKMAEDAHYCICPKCKECVFPRYVNYLLGYPSRSGLYWCPK